MIRRTLLLFLLATCLLSGAGPLQPAKVTPHRIEARSAYPRLLAVVPLIGAGTKADPIRPAYAPGPRGRGSRLSKPDPTGILGFNFIMSDDFEEHVRVASDSVSRDSPRAHTPLWSTAPAPARTSRRAHRRGSAMRHISPSRGEPKRSGICRR